MRYPYEVNLVGDAQDHAAGADPAAASARPTGRWREQIEADVARLVADRASGGR